MYPPKVHQFAYVTDEACTEDEILSIEIIIMKVHTHMHEDSSLGMWSFCTCFSQICLPHLQKLNQSF